MTYDIAANLTACGFTRENFTFVGWAKTSGGSVAYKDRQSVINLKTGDSGEAEITLYAV